MIANLDSLMEIYSINKMEAFDLIFVSKEEYEFLKRFNKEV